MTLRRLTKNTIAVSRLYNLIQWIISMTGWLRSWRVVIRKRLVRILIPPPSCASSVKEATREAAGFHNRAISVLWILLVMAATLPARAQTAAAPAKKPSAKATSAANNKKTPAPAKKHVAAAP